MDASGQILLSAKQLSGLLDLTKRALQIRAEKESWPYLEKSGRGGKAKKYFLQGLPMDIQLLYNKEIAKGVPTGCEPSPSLPGEPRQLALEGYSLLPAGVSTEAPAPALPTVICPGLTMKQSAIAVARYDLVLEYVKAKDRTRSKKARGKGNGGVKHSIGQAVTDFADAYNTGMTHPQIFERLGRVAKQTLEKWRHLLRINNMQIDALAPHHGDHRRGRRVVTDAEMATLLTYALHPNQLRISQVIRWAKKSLEKDGLASPSSEATMRRALLDYKEQNYDRWVFCRKGEKALDDLVLPYLERDDSRIEVGDVLIADGHRLNFKVRNPYNGKDVRPTILVFYDWRSRYPAGWYIMMEENIQCVHAALRRAILNLGKIPKMVLLDNGKAFKAKVFTHKLKDIDFEQAGIRGLYARLGIETYFAMPYNAKAKPVERFFGTFNELERLFPSYSGQSIEDKPAYLHRNERQHKRFHNPWVPDIKQTDVIIAAWAYDEYAKRPHSGLKGECPIDVWNAGKGPGIDAEGLRYLMMTQEIKTIHRNGITLFGLHFWDEALYGYRKQVLIRHDILDLSEIYVHTADDSEFICTARPFRGVHPVARLSDNPLDLEAVQECLRTKKKLKHGTTASEARASAANILPWGFPETVREEQLPMTPAQIEDIEAEAAQTEVIHLGEKREPEIAMWDGDRYEQLLDRRIRGGELTTDEMIMMAAFEKTANYRMLESYYRNFEERLIMEVAEQ